MFNVDDVAGRCSDVMLYIHVHVYLVKEIMRVYDSKEKWLTPISFYGITFYSLTDV